MQTSGAQCGQSQVDGVKLANVVLAIARQRLLSPTAQEKLKKRLQLRANEEQNGDTPASTTEAAEAELRQIEMDLK